MLSELREYIDACFTGLWVQTHEPEEEMILAPRRRITRRPVAMG